MLMEDRKQNLLTKKILKHTTCILKKYKTELTVFFKSMFFYYKKGYNYYHKMNIYYDGTNEYHNNCLAYVKLLCQIIKTRDSIKNSFSVAISDFDLDATACANLLTDFFDRLKELHVKRDPLKRFKNFDTTVLGKQEYELYFMLKFFGVHALIEL